MATGSHEHIEDPRNRDILISINGELFRRDRDKALQLAREAGWLMASEVLSVGVDLSFAPVLDLDLGVSEVIGDRAFHRRPEAVSLS